VSKKIKPEKHTCNYCQKDMSYSAEVKSGKIDMLIPVCTVPSCPAYALLQISAEKMPRENLTLDKIKKIDKKFFKETK
jgi:hypothetical protein